MRNGNVSQQKKTPRPRRPRRSTEEIVHRLIEAACEQFEHHGYAGTKTADIARKAGVVEALIFSNFGSKAELFHDSIFKPLDRHFQEFCSSHLVDTGDTQAHREEARRYILELQQFIGRHSKMLSSLVAAQMYASDDLEGLSQIQGLHDYFSRAAEMAKARVGDKPKIDTKLLARISFATILACIIFKDWLFPKGLATKDEISTAITDFIMDGLNANAGPTPNARQRSGSKKRR